MIFEKLLQGQPEGIFGIGYNGVSDKGSADPLSETPLYPIPKIPSGCP